ncbi:unnamed protein product [Linum trigynum]|uniref:Uncharacterized protein n=1 Tax=Linum trigynum TaxID=586398 RepID=A0AAV2EAY1_9ROSI
MVCSRVWNGGVNWKFRRRKLDVWGDGEPPSALKKESRTRERSYGRKEELIFAEAPIEQLKISLVAVSAIGKVRPETILESRSSREEKKVRGDQVVLLERVGTTAALEGWLVYSLAATVEEK